MLELTPWPGPGDPLTLAADEVHVWRVSLDQPRFQIASWFLVLAPEERARALRFRSDRDRLAFVAARGALRVILSRYLDLGPARIQLKYGSRGKPALADSMGEHGLAFNLSHSEHLALYAVARRRAVGIDLERIRSNVEIEDLARAFFSSDESATLLALPARLRLRAFFTCWTRKEAYVKARGDGLSIPLDHFAVTLAPVEPARLLHSRFGKEEPARWSLRDLQPASGYAAAIAVDGHGWRLTRLQF